MVPWRCVGSASALVTSLGCGPITPVGSDTAGAGDGSTGGSSGGSSAVSASVGTTGVADVTGTVTDVTDAATTNDDDELPKFDHLYPDVRAPTCPIEPRSNTEIVGSSPHGAVDVPYGWFGIGGGGKCPYGYDLKFVSSSDGVVHEGADGLDVFVILPFDPVVFPTGSFPAEITHWQAELAEYAQGTANITGASGPEGVEPRLIGTFTVEQPEGWALAGSFDVPWCDLLASGACGAVGPPSDAH